MAHWDKFLLKIFTGLLVGMVLWPSPLMASSRSIIKPPRLKPGDLVGLVATGYPANEPQDVEFAVQRLQALDLKVKVGQSVMSRRGYFAGNDTLRAQDLNAMFANPQIKAIFEIRGGWGSARILSLLDYKTIRQHPKILIGFSDVTSLLLAIYAKTGLVTYHGPVAAYPWPQLTTHYLKQVLFTNNHIVFHNEPSAPAGKDIINTHYPIHTIRGGSATGRLLGGNLTMLANLMGTPYAPDFRGAILFVEDVNEDYDKIDRLLSQLKNAGILNQLHGFIFGQCVNCSPGDYKDHYGTLTLRQILDDYIKPLNIPAWSGAMIGHEAKMFVLPEGVRVQIDADKGEIRPLE